jgi:hypothetical protein
VAKLIREVMDAAEAQDLVDACWRSISMIFTANISSDFMHLELYYYDFY